MRDHKATMSRNVESASCSTKRLCRMLHFRVSVEEGAVERRLREGATANELCDICGVHPMTVRAHVVDHSHWQIRVLQRRPGTERRTGPPARERPTYPALNPAPSSG